MTKSNDRNFTVGLVNLDAIPVICFGVTMMILAKCLGSILFGIGAIVCILAGLGKVCWKMLIVRQQKDVHFLNIQMRFLMPAGFVLMLAGFVTKWHEIDFADTWQMVIKSPMRYCLIAGIVLMCLMAVWAIVLDSSKVRSHWIEEITNTLAQILILISVLWLAYVGNYYPASKEALDVIDQPESGIECIDNGNGFVMAPEEAECGLIFYPGAKVEYRSYAPLMEKLAEKGIFCVVVKMPDNMAFFDIKEAQRVMDAYPEIQNWFIGGHSLGGSMASVFAASHADSLKGIIFFGSFSSKDLTETGLPVLSIRGSNDGLVTSEKFQKYASNLPEGYEDIIIDGGCHAYFGSYGEQEGDGTATITREEQQSITADYVSDFVDRCLSE